MNSPALDRSQAPSAARPRRAHPPLGVARQVIDGRARFVRPCPACDRRLRIRVAYAGKVIECRHCGHRFIPDDPPAPSYSDLFVLVATAMVEAGLWDRAPVPIPARPAPAVA
ncbi:MAG TPA: hypothetical protein VGH33_05990 [Isosphaeraceae bacterium]|jgi:hypothetical protein